MTYFERKKETFLISIENQTGMLSSRLERNRDGEAVSRELIETYKS